jgi:hypothetical protein
MLVQGNVTFATEFWLEMLSLTILPQAIFLLLGTPYLKALS